MKLLFTYMKPFARILAFSVLTIAAPVYAGTYTWDGGGSGTWDTTLTNWNNGTTNVAWTNASPTNIALFGGTDGTYSIIVNGINRTDGLTFNASGYTLSASSLQTITNAGNVTVASGKSATIGDNILITRGSSYSILGGGTLNIASGGTVRASSTSVSVAGGSTAVVNGGTLVSGNTQRIILGSTTVSGTITLQSGLVSAGATVVDGGIRFSGNGTFNLDGGTAEAGRIWTDVSNTTYTSSFNFNGGTLRVLTPFSGNTFLTGLSNANIKEGGAKIDTNSFDATINQVLLHGGAVAKDGGLEKSGTGVLTLAAVNTFTGDTTVSAGTLLLADNAGMKFIIGANGVNNQIKGTGTVTLDGDFTFDLTGAGTTIGNSWLIVNVATLTETFSSTFSVNGFTESSNVWSANVSGTQYEFSEATGMLSVVPEPSTYALLALGGALVVIFRRRYARA